VNAGTTGASIVDGNTFRATAAGTATVRATITNGLAASSDYTQEFSINVASFVAVEEIDVPSYIDVDANVPLDLSSFGTVWPDDATNQTIIWSVVDVNNTDATISDNIFLSTESGWAVVSGTIIDGCGPSSDCVTEDVEIDVTISFSF
jgi:endo-1,4-beta-xylanase